ncbi:ciliary-associated calcium-binding coiled-coil protein 1 isoform X2 [Cynoglossus semilaevis]|uniref:ciliary-associated calcium-binding coiled-coil protein 1 isoform X2 n=1 Tax=Cynoglossus semilaevis TaxID=244447 RepID=UPI00049691D6|nr:ciliary-associated calcium-binding coiled-coil protein 1 isoform X2 [Cynoglossus semilaevis]
MSAEVKPPKEENDVSHKKGDFLQWQYDPPPHRRITKLLPRSVEEQEDELMKILDFTNHGTCMKEDILLDLYLCAFLWAKEENLTPTQISFIMALLQMLLDNIQEKHLSLVDNMVEFAKALAAACQTSEDDGLLDGEEAKDLTSYVTNNVFLKYSLFEFLLNTDQAQFVCSEEKTIEVLYCPDTLTPLEEGIPLTTYQQLLDETQEETQEETPETDTEEETQDTETQEETLETDSQ